MSRGEFTQKWEETNVREKEAAADYFEACKHPDHRKHQIEEETQKKLAPVVDILWVRWANSIRWDLNNIDQACIGPPPKNELQDEQPRFFPLVHQALKPWWNHDTPHCNQIMRMPLSELCDSLHGLEWALESDLFIPYSARTDAFLDQCWDVFELIRRRGLFLSDGEHEMDTILDVTRYSLLVPRPYELLIQEYSNVNYESDEEYFVKRPKLRAPNTQSKPLGVTTWEFIYDFNRRCINIEDLYHLYRHKRYEKTEKLHVSRIREKYIWPQAKCIQESSMINHILNYYYSLVCTTSHRDVYFNEHDSLSEDQHILVMKHDNLTDEILLDKMEQIDLRDIGPHAGFKMELYTDAMFRYLCNADVVDEYLSLCDRYIKRDPLHNIWVVSWEKREYGVGSYTAGFMQLRRLMGRDNKYLYNDHQEEVDISMYDVYFF